MESAREPAASGGPIPAASEVEARADVAALFEDIRQVLGVPVVNLIFRHLAPLLRATLPAPASRGSGRE